jgi:hypothetical protein
VGLEPLDDRFVERTLARLGHQVQPLVAGGDVEDLAEVLDRREERLVGRLGAGDLQHLAVVVVPLADGHVGELLRERPVGTLVAELERRLVHVTSSWGRPA